MDIQQEQMNPRSNGSEQFTEGPVAKAIEKQTAKIPSDVFLWAAGGALVASLVSQIQRAKRTPLIGAHAGQRSLFFGQWVPTFLLLGIYNKLVKVAGRSDVASGSKRR